MTSAPMSRAAYPCLQPAIPYFPFSVLVPELSHPAPSAAGPSPHPPAGCSWSGFPGSP